MAVAIYMLVLTAVLAQGSAESPVNANPDAASSPATSPSPPPPPVEQPLEDGRCRCVCPVLSALLPLATPDGGGGVTVDGGGNVTTSSMHHPSRQIYVRPGADAAECRCDRVVMEALANDEAAFVQQLSEGGVLQLEEKLCPRCVCQYQSRNTAVIQLAVSVVLCVLVLLVLYLAFLVCLNRDLSAKAMAYGHVAYHQQTNEDGAPLASSSSVDSCLGDATGASAASVTVSVRAGGEDVGMRTLRVGSAAAASSSGGVLHRVGHQQSKWQKTVQEQRRNIYDRRTMLN